MKKLTVGVLTLVALGSFAGLAQADDHHHHSYRHDNHGYWDDRHVHHPWAYYHGHRGYWDDRSGVRVFINL